VFHGIYLTSPFLRQIQITTYLRHLYYRLMGMKLSFGTIIGTHVSIRQPELVTLGKGAVLGDEAGISCHLTMDGKTHTQLGVRIGPRAILGVRAALAPGVTLGEGAIVGSHSTVLPRAKLGDRVRLGVGVIVEMDVTIPDDVKITSGSVVRRGAPMQPGEVWGGNPAVRLRAAKGAAEDTPEEQERPS